MLILHVTVFDGLSRESRLCFTSLLLSSFLPMWATHQPVSEIIKNMSTGTVKKLKQSNLNIENLATILNVSRGGSGLPPRGAFLLSMLNAQLLRVCFIDEKSMTGIDPTLPHSKVH